ncbi:MAG: 3-oxoacyl-[acyl-carrier-protein] synthase III C-terminal domain-containing protein, partial [Candidatus Dormibacteria bacterium]
RVHVPMERFVLNVDRFGNTGAASIPLALADADASGRLEAGARVLMVGFGAGATWGGIALEWTIPPA